jgi:TatD DNase family protein
MMIDTHCHLDINDYDNVDKIIDNMNGNIMIASGCNMQTNKRVIELVNKYNNIYGTIGIHPEEISSTVEEDLDFIKSNLNNPKIVGVGEIGLDYYWNKNNKEQQVEVFIKQIEIAKQYNKPIVIHSREATEETYNILRDNLGSLKATLHCYSSTLDMAKRFLKLGVNFGIGGVLTFKNSSKLQEVVKGLDLKHFMLETDSPYLTPEPYRGQKNEPHNVIFVAKKIAEIKNVSLEKVLEITTQNAINQFDLKL